MPRLLYKIATYKQMLLTQKCLVYLDSVNYKLFYINVAVEPLNNLGKLKADESVDQKLNRLRNSRKVKYFKIFRND